MIEQVNGPGLTGISGKSGKQGKSSLFAKLFAMLDKHAEASGKGLQFNATGLAKGKTMIASTGKGDSLISEKGGPLATAKGKQLVALAINGKLGSETMAEETATPLITANVIIDQTTQSKKSELTGKANILIAEHKANVKGENANKGGLTSPILKQAQQAQRISANKGEAVETEQPLQSGNKPLNAGAESKGIVSAKGLIDSDQSLINTGKLQASTQATKIVESGIQVQKPMPNGQVTTNTQSTVNAAELKVETPYLAETQKVTTTSKYGTLAGDKGAVQPKAGTINVAAGQGKPAQPIQAQNSAATLAASTTVQAGTSDASLADSESGSSDKGSQEGRFTSALSGDTKSASTSSTNNANFQSYLTSKTAPTMSVFDSMKHIAQSAANGQTKLEIQLDPANLGKIQITLQTDAAKNLQVHMIVDQGTTRAALEQQLPALRAALSQQGFDLSGFSMGSNGQQQASGESGRNDSTNLTDHGDNNSTGNSSNNVQQQSTRSADGSLSIRV